MPQFRCPRCEAAGAEVLRGNELEVESIEVESAGDEEQDGHDLSGGQRESGAREMHRTKIKVAEDALDANTTIAHANRADFDREGVAVVNLMSAPGAGQDDAAGAGRSPSVARRASGCSRATSRARSTPIASRRFTSRSSSSTPTAASAASATSTPTWSASAIPDLEPSGDRPARDRERRQPGLPGRVPGRRGREGDGLLGHRGRGQAAQVPADVPHLRRGRRQQDRPARRTSTSTSSCSSTTSTGSTRRRR